MFLDTMYKNKVIATSYCSGCYLDYCTIILYVYDTTNYNFLMILEISLYMSCQKPIILCFHVDYHFPCFAHFQILMRDSIGISEDQMKELRTSFNHFDKNNNNQLDYKEFKQCLVSLGHSVDIEEKVNFFPLLLH